MITIVLIVGGGVVGALVIGGSLLGILCFFKWLFSGDAPKDTADAAAKQKQAAIDSVTI